MQPGYFKESGKRSDASLNSLFFNATSPRKIFGFAVLKHVLSCAVVGAWFISGPARSRGNYSFADTNKAHDHLSIQLLLSPGLFRYILPVIMANFISKSFISQSFCIPPPTLTEENLPDQSGRVHIVTGGYAGVGQELTGILYAKGATVYMAGRSKDKATKSKDRIKAKYPSTSGRLEFLMLDLNDLSTIKASADDFAARESRLDVLVNNAGVMFPPKGNKTEQGHDLQFGTNCLGPYVFTKCLEPILIRTAAFAPANTVRILWAASSGIQVLAPNGGIVEEKSDASPKVLDSVQANYGQTKVGNVFFAAKFQDKLAAHNIVSVSFNPGNLKTELQRHSEGLMARLSEGMLHPAIFGAYTELYSGWSPEVGKDALYIMPWGRKGREYVRKDILASIENGQADRFIKWCETETVAFA